MRLCHDWGNSSINKGKFIMKKSLVVCLAILAASTSGALAAKKGAKSTTPAAAPASPGPMAPPMFGQVTDADRALYMKNQHTRA